MAVLSTTPLQNNAESAIKSVIVLFCPFPFGHLAIMVSRSIQFLSVAAWFLKLLQLRVMSMRNQLLILEKGILHELLVPKWFNFFRIRGFVAPSTTLSTFVLSFPMLYALYLQRLPAKWLKARGTSKYGYDQHNIWNWRTLLAYTPACHQSMKPSR